MVLTGFYAVLQSLLTVAKDLLEVLWIFLQIQTMTHHLLQRVRMMEIQNFSASVVVLPDIVNENVYDLAKREDKGISLTNRSILTMELPC